MNGDHEKWESHIQRHVKSADVEEARQLLTNRGVNDIKKEILNDVMAKDILLHIPGLPVPVRQKIERVAINDGNQRAMRALVDALFRYDNAFQEFLIGLSRNKQTILLKKLLKQIGVSATLSEPQVNPQPVFLSQYNHPNIRMPTGDAASSAMSSVAQTVDNSINATSNESELSSVSLSIDKSIDKSLQNRSIGSRSTSQSENLMNSNPSVLASALQPVDNQLNQAMSIEYQSIGTNSDFASIPLPIDQLVSDITTIFGSVEQMQRIAEQVRTAPGSLDPYLQSFRSGDFQ